MVAKDEKRVLSVCEIKEQIEALARMHGFEIEFQDNGQRHIVMDAIRDQEGDRTRLGIIFVISEDSQLRMPILLIGNFYPRFYENEARRVGEEYISERKERFAKDKLNWSYPSIKELADAKKPLIETVSNDGVLFFPEMLTQCIDFVEAIIQNISAHQIKIA